MQRGGMLGLKSTDLAKRSFWHQSCNHLPSSCLSICFLYANGYLEAPIVKETWLGQDEYAYAGNTAFTFFN